MHLTFSSAPADHREQLPTWAQAVYFEDFTRDEHTRCLLAHHDGELVGIVAWWTARAHHTHYEFQLAVAPDLRRQGIGTALYRQARVQASASLPFFMRDYLGEPTLYFADSLGAQTIQMVPPATMPTASAQNLREHASVRSAHSVSYPEFEQAYVDFYEWTHASWHPVSGDHRPVLARHATEAYNDYSSVAVDAGGQVHAVIAVFPGDYPKLCGETTTPAPYQGELLLEACLRRSLEKLADAGHSTVDADGHISDPHLFPTWLKTETAGRWYRLVEIPG
ncbi:GNAT family N-acetyltransferase [Rothia nasimurium]|uniref:GNAT family N-acetyltransferase n=1 Tax=Rothia nasimurium TaxID=85336 RepID=UPI002DD674E7|nr:GNAT family N-acetyltransferase [Rothia nasimurium]